MTRTTAISRIVSAYEAITSKTWDVETYIPPFLITGVSSGRITAKAAARSIYQSELMAV